MQCKNSNFSSVGTQKWFLFEEKKLKNLKPNDEIRENTLFNLTQGS